MRSRHLWRCWRRRGRQRRRWRNLLAHEVEASLGAVEHQPLATRRVDGDALKAGCVQVLAIRPVAVGKGGARRGREGAAAARPPPVVLAHFLPADPRDGARWHGCDDDGICGRRRDLGEGATTLVAEGLCLVGGAAGRLDGEVGVAVEGRRGRGWRGRR